MEKSTQMLYEDSNTLENFFPTVKKEKAKEKKVKKQLERIQKRERKNSMQMSIFGWLVKDRPKQHCQIVTLDKSLILHVFRFLSLTEIMTVSRTCAYFHGCSESVWTDTDFFGELQTQKFTFKELTKVIEKSSRLTHIKHLKRIYLGKNIDSCREKIKLRVAPGIMVPGNLLEVFEVAPRTGRSTAFVTDSHLQEIVNSSFRSLKFLILKSCPHIKNLEVISRCTQIVNLSITANEFLTCETLDKICKRCYNIEELVLIDCRNLDDALFGSVARLEMLQKFTLRNYRQSFQRANNLFSNKLLFEVDLENSLIMDSEMIELVKNCSALKLLSLKGCKMLTDDFLQFLAKKKELKITVSIYRTTFTPQQIEKTRILNQSIILEENC